MPPATEIDLSTLPEVQRAVVADLLREHAELLAANAALAAEATDLKRIVQRLEHLVAELNHVVHGKKSEKLSEDARQLAFEGEPLARH
jgi:transposase